MWTIHLPQPNDATPLRCTTDPQGPGGRASTYNDTASSGGTIRTSFINGILKDSEFVWAGYTYRVQSVTYGPASVVYNHLGDIPGCSPEKESPNIPKPHGSIDIVATNTGKLATSDESQVNITVATSTIRISIPVYSRKTITQQLQGANLGYIPTHETDLNAQHVTAIQQLGNGKTAPPPVTDLLSGTDMYVYYRDPDAGCVFAPTKGLAIATGVRPPQYTHSRGTETQSIIKRSSVTGDKTVLILPNNGGTARTMSALNQSFKSDTPGTKDTSSPTTGIPVVVKDSQGNRVKVTMANANGDDNPAHIQTQMMVVVKQVMVFVIIALTIFGVFVGLPMGSLHGEVSPYVSSILSIGVAFVFALTLSASSSAFGNSRVVSESSTPFVSTAVFAELLFGAILVISFALYPDSEMDTGDRISMIIFALLFLMAVMILTVGPYVTHTDKSTYSAAYQMFPMYYDRILSILKYTMPVAILLMFSAPIQSMFLSLFTSKPRGGTGISPILNMVFDPDTLYVETPSQPRPFPGSDETLLRSLLWFYNDTAPPKAPVDFAQYPVGYVHTALTNASPPKGSGSGSYSDVVAVVNRQGNTVVVNTKGKTPQLVTTTDGGRVPPEISSKHLLKKGASVLKEGYGYGWHIGISLVLMVFFASVLMIPSFTGGIAFKTEQRIAEDKREQPTLGEIVIDGLYGFGVPLLTLASILYTFWGTGNNVQTGILSTGPVIALVVNMIAFVNRK